METQRRTRTIEWRIRHQSTFDEARYNVRVFFKDKLAVVGLIIILLNIGMAVFAPQIAPSPQQGRGESNLRSASAAELAPSDGHGPEGRECSVASSRRPYPAR